MIIKIIQKIEERGIDWVLWRFGRELRHPSIPVIKLVLDKILIIRNKIKLALKRNGKKEKYLYAVYDLDINAITFNFAQFLIDAEYETNRIEKEGFIVIFPPSSGDKRLVYDAYDKFVDQENRKWRFTNIVVPLITLSEKCSGYYVLPTRSEAIDFLVGKEVFPALYDGINLRSWDHIDFFQKLDRPGLFAGLCASAQGLRHIEAWKRENMVDKPIVAITFRTQLYDPVRNSNVDAWAKFSKYLIKKGYCPVIIPDTDRSFASEVSLKGIHCLNECAWNIELRMALYEASFLNFTAPGGPSHLLMFNPRCSYISMNNLASGSIICKEESLKDMNLQFGQFKFATRQQRMAYKPDTYDNIVEEFELFLKEI